MAYHPKPKLTSKPVYIILTIRKTCSAVQIKIWQGFHWALRVVRRKSGQAMLTQVLFTPRYASFV